MALTIRLQRCGSNKNPHYRMVVTEKATRRDGKSVELLGIYAPRESVAERFSKLNLERIEHWLKVGALPSETALGLIKSARKASAKAVAA